jgi:methyl-accepting chemotaxis protein
MKTTHSMRARIFGCLGFVLAAAAATAIYSMYALQSFHRELREEIAVSSLRLDQARQITIGLGTMRTAMRGISMFSMVHNDDGTKKAHASFDASASQMQGILRSLQATGLTATDEESLRVIASSLEQWNSAFPEFVSLSEGGHGDEATRMALVKISPTMDAIQKSAAAFGETNRARRDAAMSRVEQAIAKDEIVTLALSASVLLVGVVAFVIVGKLAKQIKEIAGSLSMGAEQVANASGQIAKASQSLAQGSSEQAASLEETSSSSEEINSMAHRNAENAASAASIVTQSAAKFEEANRLLDVMVRAMAEIEGSSQNISKIIKVIDEIAFQTNILALNAAVEAARAGEAGMGFAVVADEVRNLAQRCAAAAKDTASLIEESVAKSHDGKSKVGSVAESIRTINEEGARVKRLVEEMHMGSREQARGIDQIRSAIAQMEQLTQTTAASSEQSAAAAEELNSQSESMKTIAGRLTAIVDGARSQLLRKENLWQ